jgi:O-antigen/teichoic acid export membrane protein
MIAQAFSMALLSQMLSERDYGLGLSKPILGRIVVFGWPLLLNGVLLFATIQGDKFLVGSLLGVEVLGLYVVAALIPTAAGNFVRGVSAPACFCLCYPESRMTVNCSAASMISSS